MKKREIVTAFDFENAFKALEEIEIPKVTNKQRNLSEHFVRSNVTNALMEDYYDVNNVNELEQAQNSRQEEIAQAKLARIEKIVDINAESPEDILPSYVGKTVIQCPQCMTLFYKDPADVEVSEEDENTCNTSEICQHCGNDSGYAVIGKIEAIEDVEEEPQLDEVPVDQDTNQEEDETENNEEIDSEVNDVEEEPVEDENEESLNIEPIGEEEPKDVQESLILREENTQVNDSLNEAVDKELDDKLKAHNDYIEYLKDEIEKAEKELENAKNEFVKKSIEARLDSLKTDLEAALPEVLKDEVQDELPAADEIEEDVEEVKESLTEDLKEEVIQEKVLVKNEFYLGDPRDVFSGYYDPNNRWNGWANPGFEKDEADRLAEVMNTGNNKEIFKYDANLDAFLEFDEQFEEEGPIKYVGEDRATEDGIKHLYFIGAYSWIWCEKEEELIKENLKEESAKELLQDFANSLDEDVETEEKLAEFEKSLEESTDIQDNFVDDVSREEFKAMLNDPIYYESFEEEKDDFEELDECSLNEHISGYLTNVYENVKSFEATNCSYENNKLMIEGNINFNSGSINKTKFEFIKESNTFVGENKDLCEGLNFTLNYINKNKTIVTESFKYKYTIGKNLVEGIIKK